MVALRAEGHRDGGCRVGAAAEGGGRREGTARGAALCALRAAPLRSAREVPGGGGGEGRGNRGGAAAAAAGRGGRPGAVRVGCEAKAPGELRAEGAIGEKFCSRGGNEAQKRSVVRTAAKKVLANGRAGRCGVRREERGRSEAAERGRVLRHSARGGRR